MSTGKPTASVEEEQERSVGLACTKIRHGQILKVYIGLLPRICRLLPLLR